ncbi:MAG: cell wall hydrolase [Thiohalomonadales bacterium]
MSRKKISKKDTSKAMSRILNKVIAPHIRKSIRLRWEDIDKFNPFIVILFAALLIGAIGTSYKISSDHHRLKDIRCLAMNVYHEARGEPISGKRAVAEVTMNRAAANKFPNDICEVVYQRNYSRRYKRYISAFSWTNDKITDIPENSAAWLAAVKIAKQVYDLEVKSEAEHALYFHADYVNPRWAKQKQRIAKIGHHIFYK